MTLLLALSGNDGLVVAGDSRGTFGDPRSITAQNDSQKKLYVASKYTAILTAGQGELGATLMTRVMPKLQGVEGVTAVMERVREIVRDAYKEWFQGFALQPMAGSSAPLRPDLALLVAGYDLDGLGTPAQQRLFQLVSQLDFAPMLHNYGFALVGVAQYALYLLNRLYKVEASVQELKALAAYVITETASQDGKVGGPVQMAVITPSTGGREIERTEMEQLLPGNQSRSKALKDLFYEGGGS